MLSSMSDGLVYATINPVGGMVMTVIAVSALLSAWVLSVKYITAGPLGLVQLGKWLESVLYIVVAIGGGAGGYAALRWVGSDLLYALGLGILVPLCHLLVVRQLYMRSQKFMDA